MRAFSKHALSLLTLVCLTRLSLIFAWAAPGTVFFVVGSDTAIWNYPVGSATTVDAYTRHPYYKQDIFTAPTSVAYQVMDQGFRDQFKDSFGQSLKITWWMMGGNIYRDATNLNVPLPNTMTLYLMKKYHGDRIQQLGDEVSLHYHTFIWSDYNGGTNSYWNQSPTFADCRADFDVTLAQYLLEEGVFPISFRSGWHFMDNDWQAYLNQLLPYCLHNDYGIKRVWAANPEPIAGVEDWSQATSHFIPFHPSTTNYQVAGDGKGWNTRSIKMQNLTQTIINQIFALAEEGTNQVPCLWNHLPENYLTTITNAANLIQVAASNYPAVSFRYCTAVEAMQRWLGASNQPPPQLDVTQTVQGDALTLTVSVDKPIFQAQPFVAVRDALQDYQIVSCQPSSTNSWLVTLPVPLSQIAKVGLAVTDELGNLSTRILRYLPDDLYLDNLDSEYKEVSGAWTQSPAFAWGLDARMAPLASNNTARVQWSLPLTWTGHYAIFAQVPEVTNAAGNVSFTISDEDSNTVAQFVVASLPSGQWVYLGAPLLDSTRSNLLEMAVSGSGQTNAYAVADVIKLAPVVAVPPVLQQPRLAGTTFSATVGTQFGLDYILEYQNTAGASAWTPVQTASGNGSTVVLTDSSADSTTRFYHVHAQWH
jgi:hypothetical protein